MRGLHESATTNEVAAEIARIGVCSTSEIKTGEIRFPPKSMGSLWVKCPLAAANKVAVGKRAGWMGRGDDGDPQGAPPPVS